MSTLLWRRNVLRTIPGQTPDFQSCKAHWNVKGNLPNIAWPYTSLIKSMKLALTWIRNKEFRSPGTLKFTWNTLCHLRVFVPSWPENIAANTQRQSTTTAAHTSVTSCSKPWKSPRLFSITFEFSSWQVRQAPTVRMRFARPGWTGARLQVSPQDKFRIPKKTCEC